MAYKYASKEVVGARAVMRNVPISTKQSIEIANRIRGRSTAFAKRMLEDAISMKRAIEFKKYIGDTGHKAGKMGAGRFAPKTAKQLLLLIKSAEANAADIGMNTSSLRIGAIVANKAAKRARHGRQRSRDAKNTTVEIVLVESKANKTASQRKDTNKPATNKSAEKPKTKQGSIADSKVEEKSTAKQDEAKQQTQPQQETVETRTEGNKE